VIGIDWRKALNAVLSRWGFILIEARELKQITDLVEAYDTFARGQLEKHQELYMDREVRKIEIITIH
jgi:hypothetical protein